MEQQKSFFFMNVKVSRSAQISSPFFFHECTNPKSIAIQFMYLVIISCDMQPFLWYTIFISSSFPPFQPFFFISPIFICCASIHYTKGTPTSWLHGRNVHGRMRRKIFCFFFLEFHLNIYESEPPFCSSCGLYGWQSW